MKLRLKLTPKGWLTLVIGLCIAIFVLLIAWTLGLIALIVSFATVLITAIWAGLVWIATLLGLPTLFAWLTVQITALFAWFATTWVGGLLMPVYSWLLPIAAKFGPFLTIGKWSRALGKTLWSQATRLRQEGEKQVSEVIEIEEGVDFVEITPDEEKK